MAAVVLFDAIPTGWVSNTVFLSGKIILCIFCWRKSAKPTCVGLSQNVMNILGYSDAAQLQRQSSDAVIKLVLRCCLYWPNRSGWRQKVIMPLRTFMLLSWWCLLGQSKGHLPAREDIIMDRLIPILTHLSSRWTVPLSDVYITWCYVL